MSDIYATPTKCQMPLSWGAFSEACPFARNFVHDWVVKEVPFLFYLQNATGPADLATMATGSTATQINSCLFGGIAMATTKTLGTMISIPQDIDLSKAFDCRWMWHEGGGSGTVTFTTLYTSAKLAAAAVAVGATALDTVHTATTLATAHYRNASNWGQFTGAKLAALSLTRLDDALVFKTTCALATATACNVTGLQYGYYRRSLA